ncbi:hypothetical protein [Ralstonia solanacearum]|uniref:TRAFAC clade GTPase domain-containing protein n=1 Tax=Ralstonia solanacearum TaxID=305 RepID=UPI0006DC54F6|nr:hypothetical protein [Ralstonia solanacearum]
MSASVVVLGGPDSGKSNYIARLWTALREKKGELVEAVQPTDIDFVLDAADHLFQGQFIQRSEQTEDRRDFEVTVGSRSNGKQAKIVVPDISGELWWRAVTDLDVTPDLMDDMHNASGALLFLREGSDQNIQPLDWITAKKYLSKAKVADDKGTPTQVMLCELIRFLELTLAQRPDGGKPRLAVVVSAWDLVGNDVFEKGPISYLEQEYPMLAGRLDDLSTLDVQVFGLSVVGGDLDEENFKKAFLEKGIDGHGWVAIHAADTGAWTKDPDMTKPVAWAIGL